VLATLRHRWIDRRTPGATAARAVLALLLVASLLWSTTPQVLAHSHEHTERHLSWLHDHQHQHEVVAHAQSAGEATPCAPATGDTGATGGHHPAHGTWHVHDTTPFSSVPALPAADPARVAVRLGPPVMPVRLAATGVLARLPEERFRPPIG
jgi:hypothetical protein